MKADGRVIQWVPGALSPRVKRAGREADHSTPVNAEVNNPGNQIETFTATRISNSVQHMDALPLTHSFCLFTWKVRKRNKTDQEDRHICISWDVNILTTLGTGTWKFNLQIRVLK
jgi:hypothetical protein